MNITIKATRQELSLSDRTLIEQKLDSLTKLLPTRDTPALLHCEVEESIAVERAGSKYRADGTLTVDGKTYRAETMGPTLEAAIDRVRDDIARELKNARGKERSLLKRGGAAFKRLLRFGRSE